MPNRKKQSLRGTAQWLRIGALVLTTISPIIKAITERMREHTQDQEREEAASPQENLVAAGAALQQILSDLKQNPYGQDLLKRGEEVANELVERGNQLSQAAVERGSQLSQLSRNVARRSSQLTHDLAERGSDLTHDLAQRSKQMTKEWKGKHPGKKERMKRDNQVGTVIGFSIGLVAATISAYLFIRRRIEQQAIEEGSHFELSHNGHMHKKALDKPANQTPTATEAQATATPVVVVGEPALETTTRSIPRDAVLVGVVNTRRYYPVETPLDQLSASGDEKVDLIYFTSEAEARAQGFVPVQK